MHLAPSRRAGSRQEGRRGSGSHMPYDMASRGGRMPGSRAREEEQGASRWPAGSRRGGWLQGLQEGKQASGHPCLRQACQTQCQSLGGRAGRQPGMGGGRARAGHPSGCEADPRRRAPAAPANMLGHVQAAQAALRHPGTTLNPGTQVFHGVGGGPGPLPLPRDARPPPPAHGAGAGAAAGWQQQLGPTPGPHPSRCQEPLGGCACQVPSPGWGVVGPKCRQGPGQQGPVQA